MAGTIVADTWEDGNGNERHGAVAHVTYNGSNNTVETATQGITSVTDYAAGTQTVNLNTNIVSDATYQILVTFGRSGTPTSVNPAWVPVYYNRSTSNFVVRNNTATGGYVDVDYVSVAVFA